MLPGAFIDFFFPPRCPLCGKSREADADGPCPQCLALLPPMGRPRCPRCGLSFASSAGEDHLCSVCLSQERHFSLARAVTPYKGLITEAIARFKYRGATGLGRPLGALLARYDDPEFPLHPFHLILPVPLHPQRLRRRGFNQSLLLARRVGRAHGIPVNFASLLRIRPTLPQVELSGPRREKNIRGAFAVPDPGAVRGRRLLLIDDVFTTGATVSECARVLLGAGADRVDVLTLARTLTAS